MPNFMFSSERNRIDQIIDRLQLIIHALKGDCKLVVNDPRYVGPHWVDIEYNPSFEYFLDKDAMEFDFTDLIKWEVKEKGGE